jgi:hypothetical protein
MTALSSLGVVVQLGLGTLILFFSKKRRRG